jgi:hypothetical protein
MASIRLTVKRRFGGTFRLNIQGRQKTSMFRRFTRRYIPENKTPRAYISLE